MNSRSLILTFSILFLIAVQAHAQPKIGVSLVGSTGIFDESPDGSENLRDVNNNTGIRAEVSYDFSKRFGISGDITFFLPAEDGSEFRSELTAFDLNAHYTFVSVSSYDLYGILGLQILNYDYDYSFLVGGDAIVSGNDSGNSSGLNIGTGASYIFSFSEVFAEVTYSGIRLGLIDETSGDFDCKQFIFALGIRVPVPL